ncbi:hypothetical protein [Intestinimonas butyriciproducens]|nr:hypothetical protein [Intestinimonas butyriciproducens]MDB7830315.1 hypothetical protein [Intestinimonas butyriciproducens]MDB7863621.1 hypothetical protein [Intestinimonas butyriciproducens]
MRKSTAKHFEGLAALSTRTAGLRAAVKAGASPGNLRDWQTIR